MCYAVQQFLEIEGLTNENKAKNTDTVTRKRPEDAAADRAICGDNSSAQIIPDPVCLTSFGDAFNGPLYVPHRRMTPW